jgi:GNAT superfamily N-acetyltransferase
MSDHPEFKIRGGGASDIDEIVRITNAAYVVELFCIEGDRTDSADVRSQMAEGRFLVVQPSTMPTQLIGSVYLSIHAERAYMGMLAVDPPFQGKGIAKTLIESVEKCCAEAGAKFLEITVINLRTELFPFYSSLGFVPAETEPYFRPAKALRPLHLVRMTKTLR